MVIESARALSTTLKYVELNPVRGKLLKNPIHYHWSSWGEMNHGGHHPYRRRIIDSLRWAYSFDPNCSDDEIFAHYGADLVRLAVFEFLDDAEFIYLASQQTFYKLMKRNSCLTHDDRIGCKFDEEFKT